MQLQMLNVHKIIEYYSFRNGFNKNMIINIIRFTIIVNKKCSLVKN